MTHPLSAPKSFVSVVVLFHFSVCSTLKLQSQSHLVSNWFYALCLCPLGSLLPIDEFGQCSIEMGFLKVLQGFCKFQMSLVIL